MNITSKDLILLGLTATVGAIIGTVCVGVVVVELAKRNPTWLSGIQNYLVAGVNGVNNQSASL